MKKIFAGLMALMLLFCGVSALAEKPLEKTEVMGLALRYANLTDRDPVRFTRVEKEETDGQPFYFVSFHCRKFDYEMRIDPFTGDFRDFRIGRCTCESEA